MQGNIVLIYKVTGIDKILKNFNRFHIEHPKILSRAMNKAGRVATTASLVHVRKSWNLRAGDLKRKVKIKPASVNDTSYVFKMHSTPINLHEFYAKKINTGVSYKIQKTRKKRQGAFIQGSGRNTYVLKREGKARYPILPHFSVTPSYMFSQEEAEKEFVKAFWFGKGGRRGFKKEYLSQIRAILIKK